MGLTTCIARRPCRKHVVPAEAGTHTALCCRLRRGVRRYLQNSRRRLMVWTAPYGISVPE
jgi:hypothetical protein